MNILPPFSMVVARPWITLKTHDIVLIKAGTATGATFLGQDNCHSAHSVADNTYTVEYRFHSKPFIYEPRNLIRCRDACTEEVLGGFGVKPIKSDADVPTDRIRDMKDVLFMLTGFWEAHVDPPNDIYSTHKGLPNPLSITGSFAQLHGGKSLDPDKSEFGPADYYSFVFRTLFERYRSESPNIARASSSGLSLNTICFWGEQYYYNPGLGDFSGMVFNTGHLKETATMPGSAMVRRGAAATYSPTYIRREGLVP
jgi:hypothetical protein